MSFWSYIGIIVLGFIIDAIVSTIIALCVFYGHDMDNLAPIEVMYLKYKAQRYIHMAYVAFLMVVLFWYFSGALMV